MPAPLRALMWWPPTAFVLVMVSPGGAAASIALSGVVLMVLGTLVPAVANGLRRPAPTPARPGLDPPTVEMPTIEFPSARRAA